MALFFECMHSALEKGLTRAEHCTEDAIFRQDCRASGVRPLRVLGFRTARTNTDRSP